MLLMGTEETLQGFRPEPFVAALGQILDRDDQPQMVWKRDFRAPEPLRSRCHILSSSHLAIIFPFSKAILACRTLTNMLEAIPNSASAVARTASSLCAKVRLSWHVLCNVLRGRLSIITSGVGKKGRQ